MSCHAASDSGGEEWPTDKVPIVAYETYLLLSWITPQGRGALMKSVIASTVLSSCRSA